MTRQGGTGLVNLHISNNTTCSENPILFAESNLGLQKYRGQCCKTSSQSTKTPFKGHIVPVGDSPLSLEALQQFVQGQILLPWTQITCLFIDSALDRRAAQALLAEPGRRLTFGNQPVASSMRVVIVLTRQDTSTPGTMDSDTLEIGLEAKEVILLDLRRRNDLSDVAMFEPLRQLIQARLSKVRDEEERQGRLFSAVHLNAFWKASLTNEVGFPTRGSLDLLAVARHSFPPASIQVDQVRRHFDQFTAPILLQEHMNEFIASALLMDAYPPGMHSKSLSRDNILLVKANCSGFPPAIVFATLYEETCKRLLYHPSVESAMEEIIRCFENMVTQMTSLRSSAAIRRDCMERYHQQYGQSISSTVCLVCSFRPPEYMLPCRHSVCENCVTIFGKPSHLAEYHVELSRCPTCNDECGIVFRQLPPTKHPIILSLDGGGVRGIIQHGLLMVLEARLGV